MTEAIIIAIIGFLGAVVGSGLGIIASAKLTNYRLEQLEKKVNLHNNVVERMYKLEQREALLEQHVEDLHREEE
jgi:ABC-type lipoprotein release transport system permease subunit